MLGEGRATENGGARQLLSFVDAAFLIIKVDLLSSALLSLPSPSSPLSSLRLFVVQSFAFQVTHYAFHHTLPLNCELVAIPCYERVKASPLLTREELFKGTPPSVQTSSAEVLNILKLGKCKDLAR